MSECKNEYFILNDEIKKNDEFSDKFVNEGNSLYEVIRVINGIPLFLEKHMQRLNNSSKVSGLNIWLLENEIKKYISLTIKCNKVMNGNIKMIFNFKGKNNQEKTFLCYFIEHHYLSEKSYEKGVKTILYHGERQNPNAKIINSDFRISVDKEINKSGAYEAILVDRNGFITEGSKSNIFLISNESVFTTPLESVLPGVTRTVIIELLRMIKVPIFEKNISCDELNNYDALFISGTSPKVLPICSVDDIEFNSSKNELLINIEKAYDNSILSYIALH